MIEIKQLSLPYAISDFYCYLSQGKLIGIVGENGAGKSTLLKAIAGIISPFAGEIYIHQRSLLQMSRQERNQMVSYLAQQNNIAWDLIVYDVISLGLPFPISQKEQRAKILAIAKQFQIQDFLNKPYQRLSGGEKMRVQLARCCIKQAPLLLVDEPIASLDPYYQIDVMEQLKALTPERTCLIVIHHLPLAYRFCDEILLLKQGRLVAYGKTEEVLTNQNLAFALNIQANIDIEKKEIWQLEKIVTSR